MKRVVLIGTVAFLAAVLCAALCWLHPTKKETQKNYWENWSTWANLSSIGRVVLDYWEYADANEADALIHVQSLADLMSTLQNKSIGSYPVLNSSSKANLAKDGWGRPFEFERTTIESGIRFRILSAGADGVFDAGQGDDLYIDFVVRDHVITEGMIKQIPGTEAAPWIVGDIAAGSKRGPSGPDLSVAMNLELRVDDKVENGTAYDRATVDLGKAKKVVLPDSAVIRRAREAGKVKLFMAKTLSFGGHPPKTMTIEGARRNMGCVVRISGECLVVATYGEWDSRKEGGAYLKLVAVVPEGVEVEQTEGLSGPDSAGRASHVQSLTRPKDAQGGYSYGPASPAEGWTAVPAVPDPERTAKKNGF
jgi:hypothetical protein